MSKINRYEEEAIQLALEVGFMVNSRYGQEAPKLMPVSDTKTLVDFYRQAEQRGIMEALRLAEDHIPDMHEEHEVCDECAIIRCLCDQIKQEAEKLGGDDE